MVDLEMYRSLESQYPRFSSYHSLHHLSVDLTEEAWDWDFRGSPQNGASDEFVFKNLGFPALTEFEIQVSDLTIKGERPGPMELVDWEPLKYLRLSIIHWCVLNAHFYRISRSDLMWKSFAWISLRNIKLFLALSPHRFPSLTTLEIGDETWNHLEWKWNDEPKEDNEWDETGRCYWGLVPSFLTSVKSGMLQNLVNLWVDRNVLSMPRPDLHYHPWSGADITFYSVKELWSHDPEWDPQEMMRKQEWVANLQAVFERMESLRVGLGPMDDVEVGFVLSCCSSAKLAQFGFHWNWQAYGREDVRLLSFDETELPNSYKISSPFLRNYLSTSLDSQNSQMFTSFNRVQINRTYSLPPIPPSIFALSMISHSCSDLTLPFVV
jgi:hypothetical protein